MSVSRPILPQAIELRLKTPEQTWAAGRALGEVLRSGDLVALCGPLGAGKTSFVKGLALGLGVPADEPIVSPTFVLVREYAGQLKLYHLDAYRLQTAEELAAIGWEEMCAERDSVVAIEWADRVPKLIGNDAWRIELAYDETGGRRLQIAQTDTERLGRLAAMLAAILA